MFVFTDKSLQKYKKLSGLRNYFPFSVIFFTKVGFRPYYRIFEFRLNSRITQTCNSGIMKTCKILLSCLLATLLGLSACDTADKEDTYPQITPLGEHTCTGRLVLLPNPPHGTSEPTLPGMVLGLETSSENYVLNVDGHWIPDETITIAGITYSVGNQVGISGTATCVKISDTERYSELTIKSIDKQIVP